MANKDATIIIWDVGTSMSANRANLELSRDIILQLVSEKKLIHARRGDHVGIILGGTDYTNNKLSTNDSYLHLDYCRELGTADFGLLKFIHGFHSDSSSSADMSDALILALHSLNEHVKHYKFHRKVYLFTDGSDAYNSSDNGAIQKQIRMHGIQIKVIAFEKNGTLSDNVQSIMQFMETDCNAEVFSQKEAKESLTILRPKQVKPVTTFRGSLEIGSSNVFPSTSISIKIWAYNQTSQVTLPSAKKFSTLGQESHEVIIQRDYQTVIDNDEEEDENRGPILLEDLTKSYKYGKQLIPFTALDESNILKFETIKSMVLVGFVNLSEIKQYMIMSNTIAIIPDPSSMFSLTIFSALFYSGSIESNYVALVRYCRSDNAPPKLGVMIPEVGSDKQYCVWVHVPYSEDVNVYDFPSLKEFTTNNKRRKIDTRNETSDIVRAKMEAFIESMDLMNTTLADGEMGEGYAIEDVVNPGYQRLYQCVSHRALHPEIPLPEIDPRLLVNFNILPSILDQSTISAKELEAAFTLTKADKTDVSTKQVFTDMAAMSKSQRKHPSSTIEDSIPTQDMDIFSTTSTSNPLSTVFSDLLSGQKITHVGKITPISDFKHLAQQGKFSSALHELIEIVEEFVGGEKHMEALDCIIVMRKYCAEQDQAKDFNALLGKCKLNSNFWKTFLREKKVGLITKNEASSGCEFEEHEAYHRENDVIAIEDVEEADDLLDMMD